jgi:hypothetical protein
MEKQKLTFKSRSYITSEKCYLELKLLPQTTPPPPPNPFTIGLRSNLASDDISYYFLRPVVTEQLRTDRENPGCTPPPPPSIFQNPEIPDHEFQTRMHELSSTYILHRSVVLPVSGYRADKLWSSVDEI